MSEQGQIPEGLIAFKLGVDSAWAAGFKAGSAASHGDNVAGAMDMLRATVEAVAAIDPESFTEGQFSEVESTVLAAIAGLGRSLYWLERGYSPTNPPTRAERASFATTAEQK